MIRRVAAVFALLALSCSPAGAWGVKGHAIVNGLAAAAFPQTLPAFLRTHAAREEIGALGSEEDRLKGAGTAWDAQNDPAHYVDIGDDGTIAGLALDRLPSTRARYDSELRRLGSDQYRSGYLPYAILEGWEQLRDEFAEWRSDGAAHRDAQRRIDEMLIVHDVGVWGHFVGDGSQPLHATIHYNDGGVHSLFENDFVNRFVSRARVAGRMRAPAIGSATASQYDVIRSIMAYLRSSHAAVPQLYRIAHADGFTIGSPEAIAFTGARLAAGANELRDLVAWAWAASSNVKRLHP